ncbi:PLP-dependent aminotransferase family protein [uncultured Cloacibacillus sp.]|uniref:aminotransferase-like domain-containing protein n=1 Tax=uncultured Cloacibacillus sp. TaxID=889794 RepID=UPI0026DB4DB8|nr:PLP-dependent aminotransferase family protein [uncultured Cloacibacillus sp.]
MTDWGGAMVADFIELDKNSKTPVWEQIYRALADAADSGALAAGARLPSVRELAAELRVSRSPVENAYARLTVEGKIESVPKSGCFVARGGPAAGNLRARRETEEAPPRFDFRSGSIDAEAADAEAWGRCVRAALKRRGEIITRGDPRGEPELRRALAAYAYRARGVRSEAENVVVASGTQQLLFLLCRALGEPGRAAVASPGFEQGERILRDCGWSVTRAESPEAAECGGAELFLEISSKRPAESFARADARRKALASWAREGRLLVEDDYNGELRWRARPIPAAQALAPDNAVYIGSFSQMLLPSVRIAYMALPARIAERCAAAARLYDPTAGKAEQLALAEYIVSGGLERHLRRCRKIYLRKNRLLAAELRAAFGEMAFTILESYTAAVIPCAAPEAAARLAAEAGAAVERWEGGVALFFAGIPSDDIPAAVSALRGAWLGSALFPHASRGARCAV